MTHQHRASDESSGTRGARLLIALALNLGITLAQIVGGLISGSLALLADAAHNFSDAASIGISYLAWRISRREPDERRTFGYKRAETIGALINLTTLFVIGLYLLYEAAARLFNPQDVGGWIMVIVGVIAFVEDLLSVWVLSKERGSLNVRSAFLHMIADTLATVGVVVGGVLILLFDITWVDPVITAAIALYIFVHAYKEIRHAIRILMESAPPGTDIGAIVASAKAIEGVEDMHHVHVWQPDEERTALEAHVAVSERDLAKVETITARLKDVLHHRFGIEHAMLEVELADRVAHERDLIQE